jgi:hypothetical protein
VQPNDNFNDNALGSGWALVGSGAVETNGRLEITPPAGGAKVGIRTLGAVDFSTPVRVQILNMLNGGLGFDAIHAGFRVVDRTTGNYAEVLVRSGWAGSGSTKVCMANGSEVESGGANHGEDDIDFRLTVGTTSQYSAGGKYLLVERSADGGQNWQECGTTFFMGTSADWAAGWDVNNLELQLVSCRSSGEGTAHFDNVGLASGDGGGVVLTTADHTQGAAGSTVTVVPGGSTFTPVSVALGNAGQSPLGALSVAVISGPATAVVAAVDADSLDLSAGTGVGSLADGSTTVVVVRVTSANGGTEDYALTISKQSSTSVPGDTFQWLLTGRNSQGTALGQTPVFSTSNPAVATVSPTGLVTAVDPGTATITALYVGGKTAELVVTVNARP